MESLIESKFEDESSIVCMDELSVDVDAESFYKFNWRLYLDDEFRTSFYENPKKVLEQAGLNNVPLPIADLRMVEPLTSNEHEILQILNDPAYTPLRAEEWLYLDTNVAVSFEAGVAGIVAAVVVIVIVGAPADGADLVPEILRKKE